MFHVRVIWFIALNKALALNLKPLLTIMLNAQLDFISLYKQLLASFLEGSNGNSSNGQSSNASESGSSHGSAGRGRADNRSDSRGSVAGNRADTRGSRVDDGADGRGVNSDGSSLGRSNESSSSNEEFHFLTTSWSLGGGGWGYL